MLAVCHCIRDTSRYPLALTIIGLS